MRFDQRGNQRVTNLRYECINESLAGRDPPQDSGLKIAWSNTLKLPNCGKNTIIPNNTQVHVKDGVPSNNTCIPRRDTRAMYYIILYMDVYMIELLTVVTAGGGTGDLAPFLWALVLSFDLLFPLKAIIVQALCATGSDD